MKTKIDRWLEEFGEKNIRNSWSIARNRTEFLCEVGIPYTNGTTSRFINECMVRFELTGDHFDVAYKNRQYEVITIPCPVCGTPFETQKGHPKAKQTCSCGCANTYFRSGTDNGMYIGGGTGERPYRKICFHYHKKECIICGESNIVAVHHMDHDHTNYDPSNLIPLCPTHHQYLHSKWSILIQDEVDKYVDEFKKK